MGYRLAAIALLIAPLQATAAQVAILQIRIVEGESAVHIPGSHTRAIIVEVTDETGSPVSGAAVSFHLPEDGPSGTFGNRLRTAIATTDARGRAGILSFQVNHVAGRFQIRIVASKEQARAGVVSLQYIAEEGAITPATSRDTRVLTVSPPLPRTPEPIAAPKRNRSRWYILAAATGGGIAAGILVTGRSGQPAPPIPQVPQAPVLTIGSPSVSLGKP